MCVCVYIYVGVRCCRTTARLLFHCCFTPALLLFYCCFTYTPLEHAARCCRATAHRPPADAAA